MAECSIEGCGRQVIARGWCKKHYARWRTHGDPTAYVRVRASVCSVEGCDSRTKGLGLCLTHYTRQRKYGTTNLPARPAACVVDGCGGQIAARGLCERHYTRYKRHGTPMPNPSCRYCGKTLAPTRSGIFCSDECVESDRYWKRKDNNRSKALARYGLTQECFDKFLAEQGGKCAICGTADPTNKFQKRFSVDHDHATGRVRGLLCQPCNVGLGAFKDNPTLLRAAIKYLGRDSAP